jgi:hypothetical protein
MLAVTAMIAPGSTHFAFFPNWGLLFQFLHNL